MPGDPTLEDAILAFQQGALDRARSIAGRHIPDPQAQHLLGLIECRSGDVASGIAWLQRAFDADPGNLQYRVMLARALIDGGRPRQALDVAEPPAGASAAEMALWHARAEAADALGDWDASAQAWRRLAVARPELRRDLARALARAGRFQESADELARWVEASPADIGNRIMFARLLADLGRNGESQAQLDKAAQLAGLPAFDESANALMTMARGPRPGRRAGELDPEVLRELAQLLERTNRLDSLQHLLDAARAEGILPERLGYPAAAAALRQGDPGEARRLLLAQPAAAESVRWHWLMARIEDALGEPAAAFAQAEAMNRAERDHAAWRVRGTAHLQFVRELAGIVTPEWAAGLKTPPQDERRNPAFLAGFPRSGTTLLDTFLMGHPDAAVLEEIPLLAPAQKLLGEMGDLPRRSPAELGKARAAFFGELDRHVDPAFAGLVVDKMPLHMIAAPFLHALFREAPFVFVQRHPCDAVLSCFMQGFALNDSMACFLDIEDAAAYYDAAMTLWERSRDVLGLRAHTLAYEELVADPEAALRPLLAFLGLEWREELLDHRATARVRGGIGTPSYSQVTEPLSGAASGRWKRYETQLEPVLPLLLKWAERLGYRG
ncbi:MAG TPA: sulfotransferase [Sphingomicrobium sp.]